MVTDTNERSVADFGDEQPVPKRDADHLAGEIDRLADFLLANFQIREGGAVDNAIHFLTEYKNLLSAA